MIKRALVTKVAKLIKVIKGSKHTLSEMHGFLNKWGSRARGSSGAVLSFFAPVFLCGPSAIYHWGSIGTSKPHIEVYLCRLLAKNFLGIFCTLYVGYGEAFL